ncbi:MAG: exonuclease SbcCD subunit D, partial [Muribaculaceae bacterium]
LYNYDRTDEQSAMLEQIRQIVEAERPDAFVLCGDIYHTSQPSAAVQTLFTNAITDIHNACREMVIVIIAGNHDSGSKHEIFRTPWRALGVHVIGNIDKDAPEDHIIEIPGKGFIVAIPYVHYRNMPQDFVQQELNSVNERNSAELPVVLTAHTTVSGCDYKGHDQATEYIVGGIDALDLEQMGEGYDYLALGHIHHEQWVRHSKRHARYSGSPLAVGFDECYPHTVSIVEIAHHGGTPTLRQVEIANPRPLVTLPADGFASWDEAKQLLTEFPADIPAYIRLNVEVADFLPPEASAEAIVLTENKQCRFCLINAKRKDTARSDIKAMTVQEFRAERPIDIARRYADDIGFVFDDDTQALFSEAFDAVTAEQRNS